MVLLWLRLKQWLCQGVPWLSGWLRLLELGHVVRIVCVVSRDVLLISIYRLRTWLVLLVLVVSWYLWWSYSLWLLGESNLFWLLSCLIWNLVLLLLIIH